MEERELLALVSQELEDAKSYIDHEIGSDREDAIDRYYRKPYGDEVEGKSSIITSDVRDAVHDILMQILEIFLAGDNPVEFKPNDAGDVKQAELETKYVRYVFEQENKGYDVLYSALFDALLEKNGFVKVFWDETVKKEREEYSGLSDVEFIMVANDPEVEIVEHTRYVNGQEVAEDQELPQVVDGQFVITHDLVVRRKSNVAQIRVVPIPPENIYVSRNHDSICLDDAQFVCEVYVVTAGDLIAEGLDPEFVDTLPTFADKQTFNEERQARFQDEGLRYTNITNGDKTRRMIEVVEAYMPVDYDGDGYPEMRRIRYAGISARKLIDNEEVDNIPYVSGTPYRVPHKFHGESVADVVIDFQRLRTALLRQTVDSAYLSNEPRTEVNVTQTTEDTFEDLFASKLGGVVRTRGNALTTYQYPFIGGQMIPMFEYIEAMTERRTGVSRTSLGLDPEALSESTNAVGMAQINAAQRSVKFIARNLAETLLADMYKKIRELVYKHENDKKVVELAGEGFVEIDPRTWRKERSTRVKVGLGFSDRYEQLTAARNVLARLETIVSAQGGAEGYLSSYEGLHNALIDEAKAGGIADPDRYYRDPKTYQPPEPKPSDVVELAEVQLSVDAQDKASQRELDKFKIQSDRDIALRKIDLEEAKLLLDARKEDRADIEQFMNMVKHKREKEDYGKQEPNEQDGQEESRVSESESSSSE